MLSAKYILVCGVLLIQQLNFTKKWEGNDGPGHSYAKFEMFNGKQDFTVKLDKEDSFFMNYKFTLKKGTLKLIVKSSTRTVLDKDITGTDAGQLRVSNPKGEKFKFILKAKDAEGSYDITYALAK